MNRSPNYEGDLSFKKTSCWSTKSTCFNLSAL